MTQSYEHFIAADLIADAQARLASVVSRRGPAQAALDAARKAHARAKEASRVALSGDSGCPHAASDALEAAAKRLATAEAAGPAISGAILTAETELRAATGLAWRPVAIEAQRRRLQACRDADAARALLTAAEAAFKDATALARVAATHGSGTVVHDSRMDAASPSLSRPDHPVVPPTFAEEAARMDRMDAWPEMAGEFPA